MASSAKHLGAARRYGTRYGRKLRQKAVKIEAQRRQPFRCPSCGYQKVHRLAPGIWDCHKCEIKFTAKAYTPQVRGRIQVTEHKQFGLSEQHLAAAEERMNKVEAERERRRQEREEAERQRAEAERLALESEEQEDALEQEGSEESPEEGE